MAKHDKGSSEKCDEYILRKMVCKNVTPSKFVYGQNEQPVFDKLNQENHLGVIWHIIFKKL